MYAVFIGLSVRQMAAIFQHRHAGVVISTQACRCCYFNTGMQVLLFQHRHAGVVISTQACRCCYFNTGMQVLLFQHRHAGVVIMSTSWISPVHCLPSHSNINIKGTKSNSSFIANVITGLTRYKLIYSNILINVLMNHIKTILKPFSV